VLRVATALLNVKLITQEKGEFYRTYEGIAPSMVFLDAIHTYEETKIDIQWAKNAGCHLITGHDYSPDFPGVVRAVAESGIPEVRGTVWAIRY
jgi:hypothetical protein